MKHHLKHMAIGGGVALAVLLALRVDLGTALQYALLAACPLGMMAMMFMMNRQPKGTGGHGGDEHGAGCHDAGGSNVRADGAPAALAHNPQPRTREDHERIL